ncbi:MAG TPA: winged helix-turn-helix domain-containing protein [Micromonosporaceae bacterium]|nr:winged helix-turn-helix domain-containing protein [Micromonosporaceae bacterium]
MLRILLTAADLARVRFEAEPGPLIDVALAARALRRPPVALFAQWRAGITRAIDRRVSPLLAVTPPSGPTCAFVEQLCPDLQTGLVRMRTAPREQVRAAIEDLQTRPTAWLRRLADGDRVARADLEEATTRLHALAVAPLANHLVADREMDVARRSAELGASGLAAILPKLHHTLQLQGQTLQVERPFTFTHRSEGLGIVLVPSPFLVDEVRVGFGEGQPAQIFYPTGTPLPSRGGSTEDPLPRLLGGTRAVVLRALHDGCGTVELSRRAGVSPATVSEHVTVLRDAGLVATARAGRGVQHWLTPLGAQLLRRATPPPRP